MTPERWQQIDELYHAARERGRGVLAEADPELKRKVEELLAQDTARDGVLDRPAAEMLDDSRVVSLAPGAQLGPYRIEASIGQGGMGEVFRAADTRLGRAVAIKVSSRQFTDRFEREARAISLLNHSNVCTLYDVGPNYLVMELVEGPTLAERIRQGPIPLEEALRIAKQIADALEAAHEKGIVHRDLKPANIKIRPDGSVKVLDFGLAKEVEFTADSPTAVSASGMILGTAGYMSPEQARGLKIDKRTDIWAFGVVLYEMVMGQRLFERATVSDTLAAVIKEEPDWTRAPAKVQRLLRRCLEKDANLRLRDISGVELLLEDAAAAPSPSRFGTAGKVGWIAAGVLALVAAALAFIHFREKAADRPLVRLDVDLGPEVALPILANRSRNVSLSPDGKRLVYVSGTPTRLYTRRLDQSKANELPGTDGARWPFFSPDGQWLGFFSDSGKLNKVSVEGGAVVTLADAILYFGGSWGADNNIIVGGWLSQGLVRVPATGGTLTPVLELAPGDFGYEFPQVLPGGKAVLFVRYRARDADAANIEVFSFADRRRKTLVQGSTFAGYLRSGHLVYTHKGTLFAVPFDVNRLETRGTAVPVLDDLAYQAQNGAVDVDFAGTGTMVYRRGGTSAIAMTTLQWVDPTGKKEQLRAKPGAYFNPSVSPDGKRIALTVVDGANQDIWVYDPQRDAMTRLTFGGGANRDSVWSPDGQYVVFTSVAGGIFRTRADGAGQLQTLTQSKTVQDPWSVTPDGRRLAYTEYATGNGQIWTLPLEEQGSQLKVGKPERFVQSSFSDETPSFSPDGRWLAYTSKESGKNEVYVRAFPPPASGQGGKWQISNNGGVWPRWSRNGHELMYDSGDQIMAASYTVKGDTFVTDKPRIWIAKLGGTGTRWDLSPDGKRVAMVMPAESAEAPKQEHEIVMLLNFFDELRRKAPVSK